MTIPSTDLDKFTKCDIFTKDIGKNMARKA